MYFLMFPGQGASVSQGMGKELYDTFSVARDVFQEVDDTLHQNLTRVTFYGPTEDLLLTENTQPALMAVSMAVMRTLEKEAGFDLGQHVACLAGHSLGEYTALTAAGVLSLSDCAKILRIRGQAMQRAVDPGVGSMAAVLGMETERLKDLCQESCRGQVCEIANDNAPGQIVISGHRDAVERASAQAKEQGAKKVVPLPVSAPFHCSLMSRATEKMAQVLETVTFSDPICPIVQNVSAKAETDPHILKTNLVKQIAGHVRWRESLLTLPSYHLKGALEIGPGKVLSGLMKRTCPDIPCQTLHTPKDIENFTNSLE